MNPFGILPPPHSPAAGVKLFISHDWDFSNQYDGIVRLLNSVPDFRWEDLSVPKANPIPMSPHLPLSNRTIVHFLDKRMKEADCAIFLAGVYASSSGWMQSEIEAAQEYGTPIVGVRPHGQQKVSTIVQQAAGENMVYWNASSIAEAIRRVVRKRAVTSFAEAAQRANQAARIQNFAISPPPGRATTSPPPPGHTSLGTLAAPDANVLAALRTTSRALSRPPPNLPLNSLSSANFFTSKGR